MERGAPLYAYLCIRKQFAILGALPKAIDPLRSSYWSANITRVVRQKRPNLNP
jgi:hypothetical protein